MHKSTLSLVLGRASGSLVRFRDDERGSMALIIIFTFLAMIMFGGIAVDVMRFETRRIALQQTLDRAALAAASMTQTRSASAIANEWFEKAGLNDGLEFARYSDPNVTELVDAGQRRVAMTARVRSNNFFMAIYSPNDYLEGPSGAKAAQGVSQIEVMLVLDITGSMEEPLGDGRTKIQALRTAATDFVTIVKENDRRNGVSIGMVPYAAQVNLPAVLRAEFNETNLSTWDGVANAGVPDINCLEVPTSTYGATALSRTSPIRMMAVADTGSATTTSANFLDPTGFPPNPTSRACTTDPTAPTANQVVLPTKIAANLTGRIGALRAAGNTSIAVGMRWGTALIDEAARPIYANLITEPGMENRPDNNDEANDSSKTRKIIVLMTDGSHVVNTHILDNYKTGASPIWRGTDGNYAILFQNGGAALTGGARPTNCSGWTIPATRNYFLPHMKDNSERQRVNAAEVEGLGTGANTAGACDPNAWVGGGANPTWPRTTADGPDANDERDVVTVADGPDADNLPDVVMVTATRLDWSEVWRYVRLSWVARQLYMRSGVTGTNDYNTVMNIFRTNYLTSVTNLNNLLQQNCTAARNAGIEVYGIAFAAPTAGAAQISACSSEPKATYYFSASNSGDLLSAFRAIATDISDLRLTQ